jgi:hypothetical protein
MKPLLSLATEKIRLELRGPQSDPVVLRERSAQMRIATHEDTLEQVSWFDTNGEEHLDAPGTGPALYEWTDYELFVEARDGDAIELLHRDPRLLANIVSPQQRVDLLSGRLSFRGQIGLTRLEVRVADRSVLALEVEVFPAKMGYESDYADMLAEVNSATRALALEYLRATYQGASQEQTARPRDLEFATLLRHHVGELDRAMQWVNAHPTRQLLRVPESQRIEQIRRPSHVTKKAIRQGRGQGAFVGVSRIGHLRRNVPSVRATETLDTPEHRWLRVSVAAVKRRVHALLDEIKLELARAQAQGRNTRRLLAEAEELATTDARLGRILAVEPLSEALGPVPQGFSSLRLLQAPGYREAVQALFALNQGLALGGGAIEASAKDIEVLYEYWCFLRVATWIYEVSGADTDLSGLFDETESGLRVRLAPGKQAKVKMKGWRNLQLDYNRSFAGLTGTQRPDLTLTLDAQGWPPVMVIMDAKYRVKADPSYVKQFQLPGPPIDAINQLHRYRDAIVTEHASPQRSRPVARGAALFPLDAETSADWEQTPLHRALEDHGIGALPFLPRNERLVKAWLTKILAQPTSRLAVSGPTCAAATELRRVEQLARQTVLIVDAEEAAVVRCVDEGRVHAHGLLPPIPRTDVVALLSTTPAGDTMVRAVADVKAVDLSGAATVLIVDPPTTVARNLAGSLGGLLPGVTSALALERAASAHELGLATMEEWDLVELLRRRAMRYGTITSADSSRRLRTAIAFGNRSAEWTEDAGFVVRAGGGGVETTHQLARALTVLSEG